MMTENHATTISPRLPQLIVITKSMNIMLTWYRNVLGMSLVHRIDSVNGGPKGDQDFKAAWMTNDTTDHRLVLIELPEGEVEPPDEEDLDEEDHQGLPHFAFKFRHLDELLDVYARLKEQGILPNRCTDAGAKTSFFYEDPDHNSVELSVDSYGDGWTSGEHLRHSSEFIKKPIEHGVDPDQLIAARKASA